MATEDYFFRFIGNKYPELAQQDHICFHIDGIKAKVVTDTNTVQWNKTIDDSNIKLDMKNFSYKRELEVSDGKDYLYLKKVKVTDVHSDFDNGNNNSE